MADPARPKGDASQTAYLTIRADIISGALAQGERLTEERLSSDLGLSRTPVRDALRRLTLEGFIESQGGYTTRVASFPADEMEQIFHIRQMLESYAAERAARLADDDDIETLRTHAATIMAHTPPGGADDIQAIAAANQAFHRRIVEAARSPRLTALMSMAFDVGMVVRTYRRYSEDELSRSARHHVEIAEAIAARAPDWASAAMRTHIRAAEAVASKGERAAADAAE